MIYLLYKNTLMKIKKSFGRYLSLLIIVMVGTGFYAGIQATSPDMISVADHYYKSQRLMDFKIVSTMGFTDDDADALKTLNHVNAVIPSYSLDLLDGDKAVRVHAIEEQVNRVKLKTGRMPQNGNECIADNRTYKIGDKISVTGNGSEKLRNTGFTVTGTAESVLYLAEDYGNTTVGDGKLSSFMFINRANFVMEAYTDMYLVASGTSDTAAYSKEYDRAALRLNDELIKIKPVREQARYEKIYAQADKEIGENEAKLNNEKAKGEKELANAKAKLDENAQKLKDGKAALLKSESDLQENVQKQHAEFEFAKANIAGGWKEIDSALAQNGLKREELSAKLGELNAALETMRAQLGRLPADSPEYARLFAATGQYSAQYEGLLTLKQSADTLTEREGELNKGIKAFQSEIQKAENKIEKGKNEILESEKKLAEGYREYNENLEKWSAGISDATAKIQKAKVELLSLEQPKWHIFNRHAAVGYNDLKSNIDVVASIAGIFPLFFILIVMLMASNSMARMITEERGELGTLASLGYKNNSIVFTYLFYVLSASGLGAISGFFVGCRLIPPLIYLNFRTVLPPLTVRYDMGTCSLILAVTLTLMSLVTVIACNKELRQKPAALMRPVLPKKGHTILIEKIGLLWKRLSFTWKITVRNMFRYKKRAVMTIVGVAGCTSLLLVGFGIRDSLDGIAEKQYGEIFRYGSMMILKDETQAIGTELESLFKKEGIEQPLLVKQTAFTCESSGKSLDTFLIVPENENIFYSYYKLKSRTDKKSITLKNSGVVITQKLSDVFHADQGDVITVKDADNNSYNLTVADVAENYTANYLYMNKASYSEIFGKSPSYNAVLSNSNTDQKVLAKRLIDSGLVLNVVFTRDIMQKALENNESLNGIIVLIIAVASLLAVVVLYNLTSINISERTREIATLKVLGFRDGETNEYIYREAVVLTLISIGIGLVFGVFLHGFVIVILEGSSYVFFKNIKWFSFVLAFLLTLVFSAVMQAVTYFKLRTIDMIESLKSVE